MKVAVVVNGGAGGKATDEQIAAAFAAHGVEARVTAAKPGSLEKAVESAVKAARTGAVDAVVAGGGDGTIGAFAAALAGSHIPLGILPLGTLNHFAKDLGLPLKLEDAAGVISAGATAEVDVAEVNGKTFINNSSIGVYPYMVLDRDRRRQMHGLHKWSAMTLAFMRMLRSFPRRRIRLRAEGVSSGHETPCLFVGNNQYGLDRFRLGKRDRLDSGALHVYVAKPTTPLTFLRMVARMAIGSERLREDVAVFNAPEALIEAKVSRLPVALDGEVAILETPLRYRSRPRALTVFTPARAA